MYRSAASLLLLALSLTGCGGGGGSHGAAIVPTPSQNATTVSTKAGPAGFAYGVASLAGAAPGAAARLGIMKLTVALKLRDATGLAAYAAAVSDPHSALYRKFLTPQQIADRFGAATADVQAVGAYFAGFGLRVGTWKQRLAVTVVGPQSAVEAAFHTKFATYTTAHGGAYGPVGTPSVTAGLPIAAVAHLVEAKETLHRQNVRVHGVGQNLDVGYAPQQVAAAFDYNGAYRAGYSGSGINVGIIGTGPIDQADFNAFASQFGLNGTGTITQVNVGTEGTAGGANGATGTGGSPTATPPPVTAPCSGTLPACNPEDGEAQIDVESVQGLAPNANILFYLAYVPQECFGQACTPANNAGPLIGLTESDDEIQQAINDNAADILSLSFGAGEQALGSYFLDQNNTYTPGGFGPTEFAALAAEGIAVFVSSGDAGAQGCSRPAISGFVDSACVSYPASDVSVTSVGGVTAPIDNNGRFIGPVTGWGRQTGGGFGGSGGGVSAYIPLPSWQKAPGVTGTMRNQPDTSLIGDSATGVSIIGNTRFGGFFIGPYGGTSVAAPEMASMWALVLNACKTTPSCAAKGSGPYPYRFGNAAPFLYTIYNNAPTYASTFLDVTFGNNGVIGCAQDQKNPSPCPNPLPTPDPGQIAGVGYDRVTGIGVPFASHLITAALGARPSPAPTATHT